MVIHLLEKIEGRLSRAEIRLFNQTIISGFNRKHKKIVISVKQTSPTAPEVIQII